jgi:HSP20 family protein
MLTLWSDFAAPYSQFSTPYFSRLFGDVDSLRERLDALWGEAAPGQKPSVARAYRPSISFAETAESLVLVAEMPGFSEKDIEIVIDQGTLTLRGKRQVRAPEGYTAQRAERSSYEFTRSYALPCAIESERSQAALKDGVLTLTLPKAPEVRPRQIPVRTS